ncbi:mannitol dehydrogenase family protein [Pelagovum pacificum]|uniref:Mannitol dehydrogenase family protein n=1 Tax=Pelagovum pacificum TaxID=2588711 RepID=A0A5C5GJ33_9RHOB|nr:mannitol dehydrogenase family protein [Pelagovum pacificum]QQA42712.1 mannitol dehydrogenase family protein [Pelagovum pacificum]TNY34137.1 mannitol dehydrogenase family protein [Pelagovum pacificum]
MTRLHRNGEPPAPGIVHLGLGAFFRAHGAVYIQEAMAKSGGNWGITGVSLKSPGTRDKLAPQGEVYHAVELAPDGVHPRLVTSIREVLVAKEDPQAVLDVMERARIVTLTITEKGYCHVPSTGRLDPKHPDIEADLVSSHPVSALGYIVRALEHRMHMGAEPFTVVSCDNIPDNGHLLRRLVLDLATLIDDKLARWIEAHGKFPCTMIDRIVPATTDEDVARVEEMTGYHDAAPVMHEPFRQWVVQDDFVNGDRPDLAAVGVEMVEDVAPYEHMKLRMLNGTHSSLAYLGYLSGCETIAETMQSKALAAFADHMWASEIAPVLTPPPGVSLADYAGALHLRYENPAIRHRTWQIAMDGSQKLPQRLLGTLKEGLDKGMPQKGVLLAVAAWMQYTSGKTLSGDAIDVKDPLAADLAAYWDTDDVVGAYLADSRVFPPELAARDGLKDALTEALSTLKDHGADAAAGLIAGVKA